MCIWLLILISGAISIWMFRGIDIEQNLMEQGKTMLILKNCIFVLSIAICIYGIVISTRLNKNLRNEKINGGGLLVLSAVLLLLSTVFSFQCIPGISILFPTIACEEVRDVSPNLLIWGILSLTAMGIFMVSIVFYFVGMCKISKGEGNKYAAISGLKEVRDSTLSLMVTSLIFSPILLSYVGANIYKFEDTTILNIISAIAYSCSFLYFVISWIKAKDLSIIPADAIPVPRYVPVDKSLRILLDKTRKSYLFVWGTILLSMSSLVGFFMTGSLIPAILSLVIFVGGWITIIYGFVISFKLSNLLQSNGYSVWQWMVLPFVILGLIALLSFNALSGGNILLYGSLDWESISEIFSEIADIDTWDSMIECLGLISLFMFLLFPILTLISTIIAARYIPNLKKSIWGAAFLCVISIVFNPLFIYVNVDEGIDNVELYLLLAICCYATSIFFMVKYWKNSHVIISLDTERESPKAMNEGLEPYEKNLNLKNLIEFIRKDRKIIIVVAVAFISIIGSTLSIIPHLRINSNDEKNVRMEQITDMDDDRDTQLNDNSNSEDEIEVIEEGEDALSSEDYDVETVENENALEMDVRTFITRFYTEIKPYVNHNGNYNDVIKRYFTPDFAKTYLTIDEDVPDGDIGFFDYDFITESQDPDLSEAVINSVVLAKDNKGQQVAYVTVTLLNSQNKSFHCSLNLVNTSQGWKILDYNNLLYKMKEFKQEMKSLK